MQKKYLAPAFKICGLKNGKFLCISGKYGDAVGGFGDAGGSIGSDDIIDGGSF